MMQPLIDNFFNTKKEFIDLITFFISSINSLLTSILDLLSVFMAITVP